MADRTFTEGEAYALVEDAIKRETAAAASRVTELEGENLALKNANDVLVTEKAAETQRADQGAQALIDYKDGVEQEKAREALRGDRIAKVAKVASALDMNEERAGRIVAMSDEAFTSYLADLREVAAKAPPKLDKNGKPIDPDAAADAAGGNDKDADDKQKASATTGVIPRQSAAFSGSTNTKPAGTVVGVIGAQRALRIG